MLLELKEFNVVGDIAGQYDALLRLTEKMPAVPVISVGDMCDRGPKSKEVFDFFRKEKNIAIMGNHEHMFLDFMTLKGYYGYGTTPVLNGCHHTIASFCDEKKRKESIKLGEKLAKYEFGDYEYKIKLVDDLRRIALNVVPKEYIEWLKGLGLILENEDVIITHAPLNPYFSKETNLNLGKNVFGSTTETNIIWNRGDAADIGKMQIHGHNAFSYGNNSQYSINLDSTMHRKLTGIHWPSKQIYEEPF